MTTEEAIEIINKLVRLMYLAPCPRSAKKVADVRNTVAIDDIKNKNAFFIFEINNLDIINAYSIDNIKNILFFIGVN